jgi:hypothetical protein
MEDLNKPRAPNYCGSYKNKGVVILIENEELEIKVIIIKVRVIKVFNARGRPPGRRIRHPSKLAIALTRR